MRSPNAVLSLLDENEENVILAAQWGEKYRIIETGATMPLSRNSLVSIAIRETRTVHIEDLAETDLYRAGDEISRRRVDEEGVRTMLGVPMISNGRAIGTISLRRTEVRPFTSDQIALLETFAAQAVIAIENVRQFRELQTRLEREAATSGILEVISQSRDDETPVFDVILESAARLCNAPYAGLVLVDDTGQNLVVAANRTEDGKIYEVGEVQPIQGGTSVAAQSIRERAVVHIENLLEDELYKQADPARVRLVDEGGGRTLLAVRPDDAW